MNLIKNEFNKIMTKKQNPREKEEEIQNFQDCNLVLNYNNNLIQLKLILLS